MEEKEAAEDEGVERQMFSYMVQTENNPSGTKAVTLVDSLYVVPFLPPHSLPLEVLGTFCMEVRNLFCVTGLT